MRPFSHFMKRFLCKMLSVLLLLALTLSAAGNVAVASRSLGDLDGDGYLTASDSVLLMRHLVGIRFLDAEARLCADLDGNGVLSAYYASLLMRRIVNDDAAYPDAGSQFRLIVTGDLAGAVWNSGDTLTDGIDCSIQNIATYVSKVRAEDENVLLLDAGGSLFGSAITDDYTTYTTKKIGPMTHAFQYLGYDAILLGDEVLTYDSVLMRNEVNALTKSGVKVLGTNIVKHYPTVSDTALTRWNDLLPYAVFDVTCQDGTVLRVGVVGILGDTLSAPLDEAALGDASACYRQIEQTLDEAEQCDYIIALYHGNIESDEGVQGTSSESVRAFLTQTSEVDLVLAAHGTGSGMRFAENRVGDNIPVVALPDSAQQILDLVVSVRHDGGAPYFDCKTVAMSDYAADEALHTALTPYANVLAERLDARLCEVSEALHGTTRNETAMTDVMELIHCAQVWAAQQWIADNELDLPPDVLSIAYPYIATEGLSSGTLRYRTLCSKTMETPSYSLLLVRGLELSAWLYDYAKTVSDADTVYSLYGLNYLLNTSNPNVLLGYLEYSSGAVVNEDAVFTVLVAEEGEAGALLKPYLDETWMPYEDRVLLGFTLPTPTAFEPLEEYAAADLLAAYLESIGTLTLPHTYHWYIL